MKTAEILEKIPLNYNEQSGLNGIINEIAEKYSFIKNDIVVSAIFVPESDFRDKVNPFLMKVKREGIIIWLKE